jgi:hypothetical protein
MPSPGKNQNNFMPAGDMSLKREDASAAAHFGQETFVQPFWRK